MIKTVALVVRMTEISRSMDWRILQSRADKQGEIKLLANTESKNST